MALAKQILILFPILFFKSSHYYFENGIFKSDHFLLTFEMFFFHMKYCSYNKNDFQFSKKKKKEILKQNKF